MKKIISILFLVAQLAVFAQQNNTGTTPFEIRRSTSGGEALKIGIGDRSGLLEYVQDFDEGTGTHDLSFNISSQLSHFYSWKSNGNELFRINSFGNVGIGTPNPTSTLDIITPSNGGSEILFETRVADAPTDFFEISNATSAGSQFIPNLYGYHESDERQALYVTGAIPATQDIGAKPVMVFDSRIHNTSAISTRPLFAWDSYGIRKMTLAANGSLMLGTTTPLDQAKLTLTGGGGGWKMLAFDGNTDDWFMGSFGGGGFFIAKDNFGSTSAKFVIKGSNVGIGTTSPSHKLEVAGTIRSQEVKVEASPWPDYVFEEDYDLPSIESIEEFIKSNHHLPEVPSAAEVGTEGLKLGEMNALLLKKIEELTLYTIQQEKKIQQWEAAKGQEPKAKGLEKKIEELTLYTIEQEKQLQNQNSQIQKQNQLLQHLSNQVNKLESQINEK